MVVRKIERLEINHNGRIIKREVEKEGAKGPNGNENRRSVAYFKKGLYR